MPRIILCKIKTAYCSKVEVYEKLFIFFFFLLAFAYFSAFDDEQKLNSTFKKVNKSNQIYDPMTYALFLENLAQQQYS